MGIVADDVRKIIPTDSLDATTDISWAVADATKVTTELFATSGYTPDRTDLITKYLAAHFVVLNTEKGGLVRDRMGEADQSYVGSRDMSGLSLTRYGQQAMTLDVSGQLATMDKASRRLKAQFRVV